MIDRCEGIHNRCINNLRTHGIERERKRSNQQHQQNEKETEEDKKKEAKQRHAKYTAYDRMRCVLLIGIVLCVVVIFLLCFALLFRFLLCCRCFHSDWRCCCGYSFDQRKKRRKKHFFHIGTKKENNNQLFPLLDWLVTNRRKKKPFSVHEVLDMWKTCTIAAEHIFV